MVDVSIEKIQTLDRRRRKLDSTLDAIAKLHKRKENGDALDGNQIEKIARGAAITLEVEEAEKLWLSALRYQAFVPRYLLFSYSFLTTFLFIYEVVSLHMCVLPYKCRKILEMLLKLIKLSALRASSAQTRAQFGCCTDCGSPGQSGTHYITSKWLASDIWMPYAQGCDLSWFIICLDAIRPRL